MYQTLNILSQSSLPILPIALAKEQCRVDSSVSTLDDQLVGLYLAAATSAAESYLKRTLSTKQYQLVLDYFPVNGGVYEYNSPGQVYVANVIGGAPYTCASFRLPKPPLVSVDSITYVSTSNATITVPSSSYTYVAGTPGRVGPAYGQVFPFAYGLSIGQIGSITITYTAGYGLPDPTTGLIANLPPNITAGILLLTSHLYQNREATIEGSMSVLPFGVKELFDSANPGFYC